MANNLGLKYSQIITTLQKDSHSLDNVYDIQWRFGFEPIPVKHISTNVIKYSSSKNSPMPSTIEFDYGVVIDDFYKYLVGWDNPIIPYGTSIFIPTKQVFENLLYVYDDTDGNIIKHFTSEWNKIEGWADGFTKKSDIVGEDTVNTDIGKYKFYCIWPRGIKQSEGTTTVAIECIFDHWETML